MPLNEKTNILLKFQSPRTDLFPQYFVQRKQIKAIKCNKYKENVRYHKQTKNTQRK